MKNLMPTTSDESKKCSESIYVYYKAT